MSHQWQDFPNADLSTFRKVLGSFMTGVTVVSTRLADGEIRAFTANSFTSVSLTPPLVLVCLLKTSASYEAFCSAQKFSISILSDHQRAVSNGFASRDPTVKSAAMAHMTDDAVPCVRNSLATLSCERYQVLEAGDHVILLGKVERFASIEGEPLGFYRGNYVGIGAQVTELENLNAQLKVCGLLTVQDRILMTRLSGSNYWQLPGTLLGAGGRHGQALHRLFAKIGFETEMHVPYSLFQEEGERCTTLVFTLHTTGPIDLERDLTPSLGTEFSFFGVEHKPWELIVSPMQRDLVNRYFRELENGAFGVYFDTLSGGSVLPFNSEPHLWQNWQPAHNLGKD